MKIHEFNKAPGQADKASKPIVNLAYANGFPPETYKFMLEPLFDRYRVISIQERPLWGDCAPESIQRWSQLADDLLAGLKELTDQPIIGVGHSFGGVFTSYAAVREPGRFSRLVLIDPTFMTPEKLWYVPILRALGKMRHPLVEGALRRRRSWASVEAAYENFKSKRLFASWPDAVVRTYAESGTMPGDDGQVHLRWTPEWEAQIFRTFATDVWTLPRRIKQPLMIIRGEKSDTFSVGSGRLFHWLNPKAKIVSVEGAGHLVAQEKPEEVGKLISDFLAEG
jgi:pimeloyl-ACP methyl ester carboxylesterase